MVVVAKELGISLGWDIVSPVFLASGLYMLVIKGKISREIITFASTVIIQPSITHTSGLVFAEV